MPIMVFDIPQVVNLVMPDSPGAGAAVLNNYPVNRTDFRLVRGVQNTVMFFVRDIDRHFVNLAGQTLTITLMDTLTAAPPIPGGVPQYTDQFAVGGAGRMVLSRALSVVDPTRALYQLVVQPADMLGWEDGPLQYMLTVTDSSGNQRMLWTDLNYGPYGWCGVSEGPVADPTPSLTLDPSTFLSQTVSVPGASQTILTSGALPGAAQYGLPDGVQTFSFTFANYTGTVEIDGSLQAQPAQQTDWFPVWPVTAPGGIYQAAQYISETSTQAMDVEGNLLWLRVVMSAPTQPQGLPTQGSITSILYRV